MRLNRVVAAVTAASALLAVAIIACGPTQADIVATTTQVQKNDNLTATAEVLISQGKDPSEAAVAVGVGSIAESVNSTFVAGLTATVEAGGDEGEDGAEEEVKSGQFSAEVDVSDFDVPEGPAQTGEVIVEVGNEGNMNPDAIKITPGTTVTWVNMERTNHSSKSDPPGQAEEWDSGSLARTILQKEPTRYSHTFGIPGAYTYGSRVAGDSSVAVVFVVEE